MSRYPERATVNSSHCAVQLLAVISRCMKHLHPGTRATIGAAIVSAAVLLAPAADASGSGSSQPQVVAAASAAPAITIRLTERWPHTDPINYGFDIKQPGVAKKLYTYDSKRTPQVQPTTYARQLFAGHRFRVLRIPFYGTKQVTAPSGQQSPIDYPSIIRATQASLRVDPKLEIFANLKLESHGDPSFPSYPKRQFTADYAKLLTKYLVMLKQHQIDVAQLGVLCETKRGTLTGLAGKPNTEKNFAQVYADIVNHLRADLAAHNQKSSGQKLAVPMFVGPDSYAPDPAFVPALRTLGARSQPSRTLQIPGVHYYSFKRGGQRKALHKFAQPARSAGPLWDTEYHWNVTDKHKHKISVYQAAREALLSLFDNFDNGVSGVTWWAFGLCAQAPCPGKAQQEMQTGFVNTTRGMRALVTPTGTGATAKDGHLVARGFRNGSSAVVWVVNDGKAVANQTIKPSGGSAKFSAPTCVRWSSGSNGFAISKATCTTTTGGAVVIHGLPHGSVAAVRVTVS